MADPIPLIELEFRILLLPPISRGIFDGPFIHAIRLVGLWKLDGGDDVPLAQAFRLLSVEAVGGAILRTLAAGEYPGDPRYWHFPSLGYLLPELRALSWEAMLAGTLAVEAIKGVRGKRRRAVLPAELPRMTLDWELSRLRLGARDEFIDARVRRAPAEPVKKSWRERPSKEALQTAMEEIAKTYPADTRPSFKEIWDALKGRLGPDLPRQDALAALKDHAPQLRGRRGYRSKGKSPK